MREGLVQPQAWSVGELVGATRLRQARPSSACTFSAPFPLPVPHLLRVVAGEALSLSLSTLSGPHRHEAITEFYFSIMPSDFYCSGKCTVSAYSGLHLPMRCIFAICCRQVPKFWTYGSVCCACAQRPGLPRQSSRTLRSQEP